MTTLLERGQLFCVYRCRPESIKPSESQELCLVLVTLSLCGALPGGNSSGPESQIDKETNPVPSGPVQSRPVNWDDGRDGTEVRWPRRVVVVVRRGSKESSDQR